MSPQMGEYTLEDDNAIMAAHIADLDAHTYNWMQKLKTGQYFEPFPAYVIGASALGADRITAHPFIVARALTIDRLAIEVTVAGAGGTKARLGIYADGVDTYPGALVLDAGLVAVDAIAIVAATIDQSLTKGLYWLVCVSDGTPTLRYLRPAYSLGGFAAANWDVANLHQGWLKNGVGFGALADPFVAGAALQYASYMPLVAPRLFSLD